MWHVVFNSINKFFGTHSATQYSDVLRRIHMQGSGTPKRKEMPVEKIKKSSCGTLDTHHNTAFCPSSS